MILSIHQPAYLPWLGYFDKLIRSDVFVFLDTVQFEKNSYINRNQIKTAQGPIWLTVPVKNKDHIKSTMLETQVDNRQKWKKKHLKSIFFNYKKTPHFEQCYPKMEVIYQKEHELLADFCFDHLNFWISEMGIKTKIIRSSNLPVTSRKSDLILNICQYFGAEHYISGTFGKDYLDQEKFKDAGISIEFQEYRHPIYPQLHGKFVPNLGIVDFWINTGQMELITSGSVR